MSYIDHNGEVLEVDDVIKEIEELLNRTDSGEQSVLSKEMMRELEISSLVTIRNGLLQKSGKEIEQNQEWLFGLVDS